MQVKKFYTDTQARSQKLAMGGCIRDFECESARKFCIFYAKKKKNIQAYYEKKCF